MRHRGESSGAVVDGKTKHLVVVPGSVDELSGYIGGDVLGVKASRQNCGHRSQCAGIAVDAVAGDATGSLVVDHVGEPAGRVDAYLLEAGDAGRWSEGRACDQAERSVIWINREHDDAQWRNVVGYEEKPPRRVYGNSEGSRYLAGEGRARNLGQRTCGLVDAVSENAIGIAANLVHEAAGGIHGNEGLPGSGRDGSYRGQRSGGWIDAELPDGVGAVIVRGIHELTVRRDGQALRLARAKG